MSVTCAAIEIKLSFFLTQTHYLFQRKRHNNTRWEDSSVTSKGNDTFRVAICGSGDGSCVGGRHKRIFKGSLSHFRPRIAVSSEARWTESTDGMVASGEAIRLLAHRRPLLVKSLSRGAVGQGIDRDSEKSFLHASQQCVTVAFNWKIFIASRLIKSLFAVLCHVAIIHPLLWRAIRALTWWGCKYFELYTQKKCNYSFISLSGPN